MMLLQAGQAGLYRKDSIWTDEIPPDMGVGITLWIDGTDTGSLWSEAAVGGSNVVTNGGVVFSAQNKVSPPSYFQAGSNAPELLTPAVSGSSVIKFVASTDMRGRTLAGVVPISTFVTTTTKLVIAAVRINSLPGAAGAVYSNPLLFGDENGYTGVHMYNAGGGNARIQAYNYTTSEAVIEANAPLNEFVVLTMSHQSSQLRLRVNGGAWGTISTGATGVMTGAASLGSNVYHAGIDREFDLAHLVAANATQSDASIAAIERWIANDIGLSPWW